jgi:hypothetical protein
MRLIGVLLVLVGCHGAEPVALDASTGPDAPPRAQGMTVTWASRPSVPGMLTDKITVTEAVFQLEHLQLLSDVGDTTHNQLQLAWDGDGVPADESFPEAPAARYQQILLDMRSDARPPFSYTYQIEGTWQDDDSSGQFRIADPNTLAVQVPCDVTLPAKSSMTVAIRLDLRNALNGINFKSLPSDGEGVKVVSGGPLLVGVRMQLSQHAFAADH